MDKFNILSDLSKCPPFCLTSLIKSLKFNGINWDNVNFVLLVEIRAKLRQFYDQQLLMIQEAIQDNILAI